jgi:hypothetical protein
MRLFMCHDYGPNGRDIQWETTVADEKANNIHVGGDKTREDFIKFRTERDAQLAYAKADHPVTPSEHARRRGPNRQRRQPNAQSPRQRPITGKPS